VDLRLVERNYRPRLAHCSAADEQDSHAHGEAMNPLFVFFNDTFGASYRAGRIHEAKTRLTGTKRL